MLTDPGYATPEREYLDRVVDAEVPVALRSAGAVLIEGPKGCGKTWTAQRFGQSEILLEERPDLWDIASQVPGLLLDGATPRLLDEWQRVPELWHLVRVACDRRGRSGQFILTGSAVPAGELTRHSGAGRVSRVRMRPMSLWEAGLSSGAVSLGALLDEQGLLAAEAGVDVPGLVAAACRGGWPQLIDTPMPEARRFIRDYLNDICRVDVSTIDGIRRSPSGVVRLIRSLARNIATTVGYQKLAAETGGETPLDRTTAKIIYGCTEPPVRSRRPTRLEHASEVTDEPDPLPETPLRGSVLGPGGTRNRTRNAIWMTWKPSVSSSSPWLSVICVSTPRPTMPTVYHYRDTYGLEADAVIETGDGRWIAVEVKLGGSASIDKAATGLLKLRDRVVSRNGPRQSRQADGHHRRQVLLPAPRRGGGRPAGVPGALTDRPVFGVGCHTRFVQSMSTVFRWARQATELPVRKESEIRWLREWTVRSCTRRPEPGETPLSWVTIRSSRPAGKSGPPDGSTIYMSASLWDRTRVQISSRPSSRGSSRTPIRRYIS